MPSRGFLSSSSRLPLARARCTSRAFAVKANKPNKAPAKPDDADDDSGSSTDKETLFGQEVQGAQKPAKQRRSKEETLERKQLKSQNQQAMKARSAKAKEDQEVKRRQSETKKAQLKARNSYWLF